MPTGTPYPEYLTADSYDEAHQAVVAYVRKFRAAKGCGPTASEIAEAIESSVATVRMQVDRLVRSGYLMRTEGLYRSLRPAEEQERASILIDAWCYKLKELPAEERLAAVKAVDKIRHELVAEAGGA